MINAFDTLSDIFPSMEESLLMSKDQGEMERGAKDGRLERSDSNNDIQEDIILRHQQYRPPLFRKRTFSSSLRSSPSGCPMP
jgi:hypothetical protein